MGSYDKLKQALGPILTNAMCYSQDSDNSTPRDVDWALIMVSPDGVPLLDTFTPVTSFSGMRRCIQALLRSMPKAAVVEFEVVEYTGEPVTLLNVWRISRDTLVEEQVLQYQSGFVVTSHEPLVSIAKAALAGYAAATDAYDVVGNTLDILMKEDGHE